MLNYTVNTKDAKTRLITVDLDSYTFEDDITNEDRILLTCNQTVQ